METPQTPLVDNLKEEMGNYWNSSLADFYSLPAHRLMVYCVVFILSGVCVFGSLAIYDWSDSLINIKLTFKGMYAWHTATNFALCLVVVDTLTALLIRPWGTYDQRTVGKAWIILLVVYVAGFISQRTLVYRMTVLYEPAMRWTYEINPSQRPGVMPMFLFMLTFWLAISAWVMHIITRKQAQTEELLRVRIDTILEERARQVSDDPAGVNDTPASTPVNPDLMLSLPTDRGVGPIRTSDISHVSVEDHYLRIYYQANGGLKHTLIRMPLKELATRLPGTHFIQIHRSHLVNLEGISGLKRRGRSVKLSMKHGDFELPVSRYRLPMVLPALEKFLNP